MKLNHNKESELMKRAVCSKNLINRAKGNKRYAKADFSSWTRGLLSGISFSSALDVCCGTGNQLVLFASMPGISYISGVDISKKSLNIARKRLMEIKTDAHVILKPARMEEMFSDIDFKDYSFDFMFLRSLLFGKCGKIDLRND